MALGSKTRGVHGGCIVRNMESVVQQYGKGGQVSKVCKLFLRHHEAHIFIFLQPLNMLPDKSCGLSLGEMGVKLQLLCICGH